LGGKFAGHAQGLFDLPVEILDRQSPITKGIDDFQVTDEEYCHTLLPDVERHVLARFRQRPPGSKDPQGNRDIIWTRQFGKGRVFYNALGHDEKSWSHPAWQQITIRGIRWAAGWEG
jgi:type 1 glutamine amidotransferase